MQATADMPMEMTRNKNEEPIKLSTSSSTIISTNGLKIISKLNPDAKEFYPAYLMRQKIMREIGDVGACATLTQPPLHFANNANVLKVIKLDRVVAIEPEIDVDTLKENLENINSKGGNQREIGNNVNIANVSKAMALKKDGYENKKDHKESPEIECKIVDEQLSVEAHDMEQQIEEDVRGSEEDNTDFENFEDAEGEPMLEIHPDKMSKTHLKSTNRNRNDTPATQAVGLDEADILSESALNNKTLAKNLSDEDNRERYSDRGSNETLNEYKCKEDTESVEVSELSEENELAEEEALPQILEDIKESNSLCGDGDGDVEVDVEAVPECVNVGDGDVPNQIINVGTYKLTSEAEVAADEDLATGGSYAPPNTPTEGSSKSSSGKTRFSKAKSVKDKDEKKKSEKRTTFRKLANISLSLRGKNSSAHHAEKPATRTSSSAMTRTKRLSESLHNLTSGLKSKMDSKKTEGSSRFLPRSATSVPRPPTSRPRTLLTRTATETNGMNYKAPKSRTANNNAITISSNNPALKDAISLKSVSSGEQNVVNKPAPQPAKKPLGSKSTNTTGEKSIISTVNATKSKDSMGKTRPRGTHASTLRQNEAQKRRSLFPNSDDAESNIELSQFLFK